MMIRTTTNTQQKPLPFTPRITRSNFAGPTVTQLQFGSVASFTAKPVGKWIKCLDFQRLGATTLNMVKLIYAAIIASRFASGFQRMWADPEHRTNELRETAVRDITGYTLWIFGIPILQRLFLKFLAKKQYRAPLIQVAAESTGKEQDFLQRLKRLNPLTWSMPCNQDLEDRMHQELAISERAGHGPGSAAYKMLQEYYEKGLIKSARMGTGVGWISTIAMLGLGVIIFNITMTNRKNAQHH